MVPREGTGRLCFPEDARACPNEVVVEKPLVEAPLPSAAVQGVQGVPALLHTIEAAAGFSAREAVHESFEGVARPAAVELGCDAGALDCVEG